VYWNQCFSIQSTLCNILLSFIPWPPAKRDSQYIQITVFYVRKWSAISTGLHISPSWCPYFKYGAASKVWSGTRMESYGRGWQHTMYCISIHELVILDINWHVSSSLTRADSEFHRRSPAGNSWSMQVNCFLETKLTDASFHMSRLKGDKKLAYVRASFAWAFHHKYYCSWILRSVSWRPVELPEQVWKAL
jgi:hypothetical protein